jgi:hypothetical protein
MFINGLLFLVTSLRGISLVTIKFLPLLTAKHLVITLEQVLRTYEKLWFNMQTSLMDMEFKK